MSQGFATTQWSQVLAAKEGSESEARAALEALCEAYWYPLYAFLRGHGQGPEDARDLTQAFFAELLGKERLRAVDPSKGRFRSFLLASIKNFLSHERDRARALKRGGGATTLSIDARDAEARLEIEPIDRLTPEQIFERRWGLTMMERAMSRLEEELASARGPEQFEQLKGYLTGVGPSEPYREVAARLGMSESALKTAVHRMRRLYGELLREEILETLADPAEVDDEVRHLLRVIRPWDAAGGAAHE